MNNSTNNNTTSKRVKYILSSYRILLFFIFYQLSIQSLIESNQPYSSTAQSISSITPIDTNSPPKTANKPTPGINASPAVTKEEIP